MTILDEVCRNRPGGYDGVEVQDELSALENECREKYGLPPLEEGQLFFSVMAS
jgi:hypothetical protein